VSDWVESVRLKQLSVFRYLRQPRSATTLKKWRGEDVNNIVFEKPILGVAHVILIPTH